ncbi:MAG: hypothetical protein FWF44_02475 [Defluviitaleaceae bacterium]|nr:hypothetical protein [Defluviitaleaceae bacterium]
MTSHDRVKSLFAHKKPDRIGLFEHFWNDTYQKWVSDGKVKDGGDIYELFPYDIGTAGWPNMAVDIDFPGEVVAEDEDTVTAKDGNGAIFRRHKKHDSTPEHIGFTVTCKDEWEEFAKPKLTFDERRVNYGSYRDAKAWNAKRDRFFMWCGAMPFELMKDLSGHEHMLVGMALEPEWVADMADTYIDLMIAQMADLFSKEGRPDGVFVYEDMGFKERPFMSPAMYRELVMPSHKKFMDFCHSMDLPVMMHSCGFVEPLLPHIVEAGIDGLQAMEVKAGMNLLRIYKNFGDKIALMGGIDVRELESNDRARIDAELEKKIPIVKEGFAYFLHTDHSIPKTVDFDTYGYFVEKGLELGKY